MTLACWLVGLFHRHVRLCEIEFLQSLFANLRCTDVVLLRRIYCAAKIAVPASADGFDVA